MPSTRGPIELSSTKNKNNLLGSLMWRVPKEKGELILCRECPKPRPYEKEKLRENLEFLKALSTKGSMCLLYCIAQTRKESEF
jgi:hypothetical protein